MHAHSRDTERRTFKTYVFSCIVNAAMCPQDVVDVVEPTGTGALRGDPTPNTRVIAHGGGRSMLRCQVRAHRSVKLRYLFCHNRYTTTRTRQNYTNLVILGWEVWLWSQCAGAFHRKLLVDAWWLSNSICTWCWFVLKVHIKVQTSSLDFWQGLSCHCDTQKSPGEQWIVVSCSWWHVIAWRKKKKKKI